ncbi:hypothetical protein FN846DRAFT_479986 [Sphaerosporella brunnea]|uniref:Uncharacterized protein n=1 Tax=Sphaerosporella brunnea TaxID=1250544 RepID=A0A5J5FBJ5_9PEZI|nr:hypothetical protein FN846DRAFT_479986 [Sphaerosporella brunnea]
MFNFLKLKPFAMPSPPPPTYTAQLSARDVALLQQALTRRVPSELALAILDLAEAWQCTTATRTERVALAQEDEARGAYVAVAIGNPRKLRRVVVRTRSHDQGWSNDAHLYRGTYEASWTWWEAGVRGRADVAPKELHRNLHAVREAAEHVVAWDVGQEPWLRSLREHDVVEVFARARFPGWVHYVEWCVVEVFYAW